MFESLGANIFVIAEVGQNHNGSIDKALEYVDVFSEAGADAVKFQTRNNRVLFSRESYNASYNSENAFGETYGEHREALELSPGELKLLHERCRDRGVLFMSTPFDEPSVSLLGEVGVDLIKVASFDLGNIPLISKMCDLGKPIVMSVGGGLSDHIRASVEYVLSRNIELAILHCVSEYPCSFDRLGLARIKDLVAEYSGCAIGSSDHFNGILSGPVAYLMGARVFEKHVTLDRSSKGTDHSFALEPDGFKRFVRDLRRVPLMLPPKNSESLGNEPVFKKLGKSIIAAHNLSKGSQLEISSLSGRIFPEEYLPVRESYRIVGKTLVRTIEQGEPITLEDLA